MHLTNEGHSMSDATWNPSDAADGSEPQPNSPPNEQAVSGPGEKLAAYREAHSWTIEQVASQLNLAPRQIQAIEENNYAALPGRAVTRGFIRAYAKLLKVDADPLVAMMPTEKVEISQESDAAPMRRAIPAQFSYNTRMPPLRKGSSFSRLIAVGILAIIVIGGGIAAYRMGLIPVGPKSPLSKASTTDVSQASSEQSGVKTEALNTENVKPEELTSDTAVSPNTPAVAQPNVEAPKNAEASKNGASKVTNDAGKTIADAHPTAPSETNATPQNSESTASKGALVLTAHEDSWVEIRRTGPAAGAKNSVLVSHVVKAGSTETFDITDPVSVTIGNAAGVDASFRGEPMNIKSNAKTNVARLNLK
jgi:cytoskeleton protein RodZ